MRRSWRANDKESPQPLERLRGRALEDDEIAACDGEDDDDEVIEEEERSRLASWERESAAPRVDTRLLP